MILSREGITQGCPLATTCYGLLVLPMIIPLEVEFSDINSPRFADYRSVAGKVERVIYFFSRLCEIGPNFGYFPEESKSIFIVKKRNGREDSTTFTTRGGKF